MTSHHQEDPHPPDGPHARQMDGGGGGGGGESGGLAAAAATADAAAGGYLLVVMDVVKCCWTVMKGSPCDDCFPINLSHIYTYHTYDGWPEPVCAQIAVNWIIVPTITTATATATTMMMTMTTTSLEDVDRIYVGGGLDPPLRRTAQEEDVVV